MSDAGVNIPSNGFFRLNIGHVLIFFTMLGSAFWWFVTYDRSINDTKLTVEGMVNAEKVIASDLHAIDMNGTRFSQRNIDKELDVLKTQSDRMNKLEAVNADILPKVERMTWQIGAISEWVEEQKKRQGTRP